MGVHRTVGSRIALPHSLVLKPISRNQWYFCVGVGLLAVVAFLDVLKPFDRSWSILYLLVVLYTTWYVRGIAELVLIGVVVVSVYLVPALFRAEMIWPGSGLFYRSAGVLTGVVQTALMWQRRRFVDSFQHLSKDFERKVQSRTSELQSLNELLQREVAERSEQEESLRTSRRRLELVVTRLIETQETERRYLARELHDEIGQLLTALKINLRRSQRSDGMAATSMLDESLPMVDQAIDQVRNLSINLRPLQLDELGLVAAVHWLLNQQAALCGIEGRLDACCGDARFPPHIETVCLRVAQEALMNAVRHAKPSQINVELLVSGNWLHLTIRDDGIGFNIHEYNLRALSGDSIGLITMQERVRLVGGQFEIESASGTGTKIQVRLPLSSTG